MPPRTRSAPPRPPRADARANRERILAAAHARLAAEGMEAAMDAIAADAGVAVGTLYHHFGTKEALLEAVVLAHLQDLEALLKSLLAEPDPWRAVERLVREFAARQLQDRAYQELIGARPPLRAGAAAAKRKLGPLMQQVLARAQAAGQLRPGVAPADIPRLLAGLTESELPADARERYLDVILAGLRASH